MSTWLKRIFWFLVIIIALIIIAGAIVAHMFNPNDYKSDISKAFYQQTGRKLSINGPIKLHFFPHVSLSVSNVDIANPTGFGEQDFLKLKSASFEVAFLPLLHSKIEIDSVLVDGVDIMMVQKAVGQNNWTFKPLTPKHKVIAKSDAKANHVVAQPISKTVTVSEHKSNRVSVSNSAIKKTTPSATQPISSNIPFSVNVKQFSVRDVNLTYTDQVQHKVYKIKNLSLMVRHFSLKQGFPVDLSMQIMLPPPAKHILNLQATAIAKLLLDSNGASLSNLKATLNKSNLTGNFLVKTFPTFDLSTKLNLDQIDPANYISLQGAQLPIDNVNLVMALTSPTVAMPQMIAGLNGKINLTVQQATLKGMNLGALMSQLGTTVQALINGQNVSENLNKLKALLPQKNENKQTLINPNDGQNTVFSKFELLSTVTKGVVSTHTIYIQAPNLLVTGSGQMNLVQKTLDYNTVLAANGTASSSAYPIKLPFYIKGSFEHPKYKLDTQPFVTEVINKFAAKALFNGLIGKQKSGTPTTPAQPATSTQDVLQKKANQFLNKLFK